MSAQKVIKSVALIALTLVSFVNLSQADGGCYPMNPPLFIVSFPRRDVMWADKNIHPPNPCVEKKDWEGKRYMTYKGALVHPDTACLKAIFIDCSYLYTSDHEDSALSPPIEIPYDIPGFPKVVYLARSRYDSILNSNSDSGCVVAQLAPSENIASCISSIGHWTSSSSSIPHASPSEEMIPLPAEIVFPGKKK